ncbi:hypothetical protein [Pseudomonas leptonychotis]|uniref:hypothetical protein n=1 Tax=Pseudomonas leptonychotis TaxID=2448482 RepID=UPI00386D417D
MSVPLMLGGIPIVLHAGAPELSEEAVGGNSLLRMSNGAAVKMTRWEKMAGSISGQGWMPPALDGLDYSQPLELRSTQVSSMQSAGLVFTLPSTPRPDQAPWGFALVGDQWVPTPADTVAGVTTLDAVAGATLYQAWWFPVYSVFATRPPKSQSNASASHGWSIAWQEA